MSEVAAPATEIQCADTPKTANEKIETTPIGVISTIPQSIVQILTENQLSKEIHFLIQDIGPVSTEDNDPGIMLEDEYRSLCMRALLKATDQLCYTFLSGIESEGVVLDAFPFQHPDPFIDMLQAIRR